MKAGSGSAEVENTLLHIEADFEMSVFAIFLRFFQTMAFGEGSQRLCGGGEGTISVWITGAACQLHR